MMLTGPAQCIMTAANESWSPTTAFHSLHHIEIAGRLAGRFEGQRDIRPSL